MTVPAVRWSYYLGGSLRSKQVVVADLDADGLNEIIMATGGKVVVKDGQDRILWESEPLQIASVDGTWDLDGDGSVEVVARSNQWAFIFDGATGSERWSFRYDGYQKLLTVVGLGPGGDLNLILQGYVASTAERDIRRFDFSAGFASPIEVPLATATPAIAVPFVVGDLDGDGDHELVIEDYGTIRVLDALTGALESERQRFNSHAVNTVWLADVDGSGTLEYVLISREGWSQRLIVERYSGGVLQNLWMRDIATLAGGTDDVDSRFFAESVYDLDGDGQLEIVLSIFNENDDGQWHLLVLSAVSGLELVDVPGLLFDGLSDLDGDGNSEILALDASMSGIAGVRFGDLRAYTYSSGALTQRWSLPDAAVHKVLQRQHSRLSPDTLKTASQDLNGDGVSEVYLERDDDGDGLPDALQAIEENGGQLSILAEYRPIQLNIQARVVALGDNLTGPSRPAETMLSLSNGFIVGLDPLMATSWVSRTGGYQTDKVIAVDLEQTGQLAVVAVNSRGELEVLDESQADLSQPPSVSWSFASQTLFYPCSWDFDQDGRSELMVVDWDGSGKVIKMLEHDGAVKWERSLGFGLRSLDTHFKPATLTLDVGVDVYASVFNTVDVKRNLIALDGSDGSMLWYTDERMGYSNWLMDFAVSDQNADGLDDAIYFSGATEFQIYSGVDGQILHQADLFYEGSTAAVDCTGDGVHEAVIGTGSHGLRVYTLDASELWQYSSVPLRDFAYRAPASVNADGTPGFDLAFGSNTGRLRVLSGHNGQLYYERWLHRGQVYMANPGEALSLGNAIGVDLDDDGLDEILIPSEDGYLYALNAESGSLLWALDFRYGVGEPIVADLDSDGHLEVIVSVADGYLYAIHAASLAPPSEVRDVALDGSFQILAPQSDIDQSEHASASGVAWNSVPGASGYRVALLSNTGSTIVPWTAISGATQAVFTGLHLQPSSEYHFWVTAYGPGGQSSADVTSDGFTVTDLSPPAVIGLAAQPAAFSPNGDGVRDQVSIVAELIDLTGLTRVEIQISDGSPVRLFVSDVTGTIHQVAESWDGRDQNGTIVGDGVYQITVTAVDETNQVGSASTTVMLDTVPPPTPEILAPHSPPPVTVDRPIVAGTCEASAIVTVFMNGESDCETQVAADGSWSCQVIAALGDGSHSAWATAVDQAGNASGPGADVVFDVDTVPPHPPVITRPGMGEMLLETTPVLAGTADPVTVVTVFEQDTALCQSLSDATGIWGCTSEADLALGEHWIWAQTADRAGNTSGPSQEVLFVIVDSLPADAGVSDASVIFASSLRDRRPGCDCRSSTAAEDGVLLVVWLLLLGALLRRRKRRRWRAVPLVLLAMVTTAACGARAPRFDCPLWSDADADGDCISDADEGSIALVDTDNDSIPDYLDLDSDGDGIPDAIEGGGCAGRGHIDSDADGVLDFRDPDSDGNGIEDSIELDADTDGDGLSDRIDPDDDGDSIRDVDELQGRPEVPPDTDGDGTPDFRDSDSDGDGLPDSVEGGDDWLHTAPIDTDGDGFGDYIDLDSDADALPDGEELALGTNPLLADSDGDGLPDSVEIVAGTDPTDPASVLPQRSLYVPLSGDATFGEDVLIYATANVKQMNVVLNVDTTASMGSELENLRNQLSQLVHQIQLEIPDTAFGVGRFADFPFAPYGDNAAGDQPFELVQQLTLDGGLLQSAVDSLSIGHGGDLAESSLEALYQLATGEGLIGPGASLVATFVPDPQQGPGTLGGAGFVEGALPVVLHITDAVFHAPEEGPTARDCFDGYLDYGIGGTEPVDTAHTRQQTLDALLDSGVRVVGIVSREYPIESACSPYVDLIDLALATGAAVPPGTFQSDCGQGLCCTGVGGAGRPPVAGGVCPLVFETSSDGAGLQSQATSAILALTRYASLDVACRALGKPNGELGAAMPSGYTTADFVEKIATENAIAPIGADSPQPEDRDADGVFETFADVPPGTQLEFTVTIINEFVSPTTAMQLFSLGIQVMGDAVTVLDEWTLYVVVMPDVSP